MELASAIHRFTGGLTHATARFLAAGSGRALIG
jgi:hypothetical protein